MSKSEICEIDLEIARLLKKRATLTQSASTSKACECVPDGISKILWETLLNATSGAQTETQSVIEPHNIVIVGITGVMGKFLARRFEKFGHTVKGAGSAGWGNGLEEMLSEADLVIISVTIERVEEIIRRSAKHMNPDAILADVTSIKVPACNIMKEAHSGPVVGLHPMFGPGVETFLSQTVVHCPVRGAGSYQWLLDTMAQDGAKLVEASAAEHDKMMIAVQAVRHFTTFAVGTFLLEDNVDLTRSLDFASPVYRMEADFIGRLFAQEAWLYIEIMLATEERRETLVNFAAHCSKLADLAKNSDTDTLLQMFGDAKLSLDKETARAMEESSKLIEVFSAMLSSQ